MCDRCSADLARDVDEGFPAFVRHHQDMAFGVARRWTRDHATAEDVAQEAFLRAYRALRRYDAERIAALRLRGWLSRIVLNLAHDAARDAGPPSAALADVPEPLERHEDGPEGWTERRDEARRWRRLLGRLPDRQRSAVELRHVEGLSYGELAEALGRPVGTVKSDVHRGVAALRRAWIEDEEAVALLDRPLEPASADGRAVSGSVAMRAAEVMG